MSTLLLSQSADSSRAKKNNSRRVVSSPHSFRSEISILITLLHKPKVVSSQSVRATRRPCAHPLPNRQFYQGRISVNYRSKIGKADCFFTLPLTCSNQETVRGAGKRRQKGMFWPPSWNSVVGPPCMTAGRTLIPSIQRSQGRGGWPLPPIIWMRINVVGLSRAWKSE